MLCRTSNDGAAALQERIGTDGEPLYAAVARLALGASAHDNVGLVVGATRPEILAKVRALAPHAWLLAPGVGAQGASLSAAVAAGLRDDGLGLIVNASRSIARAASPAAAAFELRDAIRRVRDERRNRLVGDPAGESTDRHEGAAPAGAAALALADALLETGCVRFGSFVLKSGLVSPIYIDMRRLAGFPDLLDHVAVVLAALLAPLAWDRIAALPYAALPIGTAVALRTRRPLIYPRKERKAYGTGAAIEGPFEVGERVVVVDDLATTGLSKLEAFTQLEAVGLRVEDVVVVVDRQSGAAEAMAAQGKRLHAALRLGDMLDHWQNTGRVAADQIDAVRAFLAASSDADGDRRR